MAIYDSPKVVWIGSSPQALQYGLFLAPKIQCGKILLNYFFRVIPTNWNSIWHIFWHSVWHIFWHSFWHILSGIYSDISSDILSDILCDILHSQLRSRSAHWDLEPRARGWGRSPRRGGRRRRWAACSLIKSKDPHLAGGTKWDRSVWYNIIYIYYK